MSVLFIPAIYITLLIIINIPIIKKNNNVIKQVFTLTQSSMQTNLIANNKTIIAVRKKHIVDIVLIVLSPSPFPQTTLRFRPLCIVYRPQTLYMDIAAPTILYRAV